MVADAILALVDEFLADTRHQSLIDADRVHDLLLDIRSTLAHAERTGESDSLHP